jgi:allophanate hydrolase subunit 1
MTMIATSAVAGSGIGVYSIVSMGGWPVVVSRVSNWRVLISSPWALLISIQPWFAAGLSSIDCTSAARFEKD